MLYYKVGYAYLIAVTTIRIRPHFDNDKIAYMHITPSLSINSS